MTLETIHLLYNYHYWRSARILQSCEALTPGQWNQALAPSWGSIHALLAHMVGAERIWLDRWKGVSAKALLPAESIPTLADVHLTWKQVEDEMRAFIDQCSDEHLEADLKYTNTSGITYSFPLGELMVHVVDHGTHHRGELVAMLTILGIPHPEDGLLNYLIERSRQKPQSLGQWQAPSTL